MSEEFRAGGCQCGAVRYRVHGPLSEPHICHCRMCQKAAGNYFMPLAGIGKPNLEITRGEPAWFRSSAPVRRGFCPACGTPLFFDPVESGDISVVLGSLDRPPDIRPVKQYGIEARMPWFDRLAALPAEETADDPQDGVQTATVHASNRQHPDHDTLHWTGEEGR